MASKKVLLIIKNDILNQAKTITEQWEFDWLDLSPQL